MDKRAMETCEFEQIVMKVNQETDKSENKLHILYNSDGFFSGNQISKILYLFKITCHRLKALEVMNKRLTRMSPNEARDVLQTFVIQEDKLTALKLIKRYIYDILEPMAKDLILSCFQYDDYKDRACEILHIARLTTKDILPAGGHMQYRPMGSVFNQSTPLDPKMYQSEYQCTYPLKTSENYQATEIGVKTSCIPPLYQDPCCNQLRPLAKPKQMFGCFEKCPAQKPFFLDYPSGAAPLGFHNPTERIGFEEDKEHIQNVRCESEKYRY